MKTLTHRRHACVALTLLALLLVGAPARAGEIVKLRDGSLVHGEIKAFDEATGFTLERADTGGILNLRWDHLTSSEVTRIKRSRGFTGEAPEPYLVNVMHLVLDNGTTESGVLVEGGRDDQFTLRRRSGTDSFPKSYVRSVETGRMDGLEIYAPDELYRVLRDDLGQPETALQHFNLAVACEGAGLYEPAGEHYQAVADLDSRFKPDLIGSRLERIAVKIEDAVETRQLDEIRTRLYRKQFEVALAMVDEFRSTYPDSRQLGDLQELEAEVRRRKRASHERAIVSDYFSQLEKRIGRLSRDDSLTLDVARESVEELVHDDILESLGRSYEMTPETVADLWEARSGGSMRSFSYGTGTFILGKKKALEFGRFDDDEDELGAELGEEAIEDDEEFADLVERVKRQRAQKAADRQASSRSGSRLTDEGPTPEEWWTSARSDARFKWMMAYYAEFADALRVVEARGRVCRMCDGLGYHEGTDEDGNLIRRTCGVCKDLKFERLVRFR
jgi:hypothetical protein